jgi:hypothetical protein
MEFKIAATAAGGGGVCALTGAVTNMVRNTSSNNNLNSLIAFPYNTIETQSQATSSKLLKKTDAAR